MDEMDYKSEKNTGNETELILRVAIKTIYVTVIAIIFAVIFIFSLFPSLPEKLYYDFGNYAQALRYAQMYTARLRTSDNTANSAYCEKLEDVISIAESLLNETEKEKYAEILYNTTAEYAALDGIEKRHEIKDAYNIAHSAPEYRAIVFSNECYIYKTNYMGALYSGRGDKFLTRNGFKSLDEILSSKTDVDYETAMEQSFFFAQLGELFKAESKFEFTSSQWQKLLTIFDSYKEFALNLTNEEAVESGDKALIQLYLVRTGGIFINYANEYFASEEGGKQPDEAARCEKSNFIEKDGQKISLIDYYRTVLLGNYINTQYTKN